MEKVILTILIILSNDSLLVGLWITQQLARYEENEDRMKMMAGRRLGQELRDDETLGAKTHSTMCECSKHWS